MELPGCVFAILDASAEDIGYDLPLIVQRRIFELAHDFTADDRIDHIADRDGFEEIAGNQQHADPFSCPRANEFVDVLLRSDIDTGGWILEHEQSALPTERAAEHDFLLIAATQTRDRIVVVRITRPETA
jgi:hypothetical protein